eukprot:scaffold43547_cov82-Cyclotella_meneghiniana.AAC.3
MRRLLSTDGHGVASMLGVFDRRWSKCQVDRPSGAGAFFLEGRLEKAERRAGLGKNKSTQVTRPRHSTTHLLALGQTHKDTLS